MATMSQNWIKDVGKNERLSLMVWVRETVCRIFGHKWLAIDGLPSKGLECKRCSQTLRKGR